MADRGELAADLVVPAGQQLHFQQVVPVRTAQETVPQTCQFGIPALPLAADETLVEGFVAPQPVLQQAFVLAGTFAAKRPIGLVDAAVPEKGGEPFQGLRRLGEQDDAADRPVQAVGDSHEDFAGLGIPLRDERLAGICQAFVAGLVSLHNLSGLLADDKEVVVFVQDAGGEVRIFFRAESSVFHGGTKIGVISDKLT